MKFFLFIILVLVASFSGFVLHVITVEWVSEWIAIQMNGVETTPSWAVRYIAGMTSLEYGIATLVLYVLIRDKIIKNGRIKASILLSTLLLALNALLIRQPVMDYLVGNPIHVVLVQNLVKWLTWITLAVIVVFGYEAIMKSKNKSKQ